MNITFFKSMSRQEREDFVLRIRRDQPMITDEQELAMHHCLLSGNAILAKSGGAVIGGVGWQYGRDPRTGGTGVYELMLYVVPEFRGSYLAQDLIYKLEDHAISVGATTIYAGSSLNSHERARALYERSGYTTTYSFRKEL